MKRFKRLLPLKTLCLCLIVLASALSAATFLTPGHASADCGFTGTVHDYAGFHVISKVQKYGGPLVSSNGSEVRISEHGWVDPNSGAFTPGGRSDGAGGNIVQLSPAGGYPSGAVTNRVTTATFSQIGGCGGGSQVVLPGNGTNGSPSTSNGGSNWGLDCDNSQIGDDSLGRHFYQQFSITGVGTPNGATPGGTWSTFITAPNDFSGGTSAANGTANTVVITYTEPYSGPSWTLSPTSSFSPATVNAGQPAKFDYAMYNNGPNTANYTWFVEGSLNGSSYSNSNPGALPAGTVPSQGKNTSTPRSLASYSYTFPAGAPVGSTYCQVLYYNNFQFPYAPGDSAGTYTKTSPNCVTLGFNPIQSSCGAGGNWVAVAPPGAGYQALVRVQDSSGNVLVPSGSSNPSTSSPNTTNYLGDQAPASYNPTGPGYPSGRWTGQAFYVVGAASGGGTFLFTPLGTSIEVTVIVRQGLGGGSYNTTTYTDVGHTCYGATIINPSNGACTLDVTGDGPIDPATGKNTVLAGGTMHVSAIIYNTGSTTLPASISGDPLQLNNGDYNGNGSYWGFSQYPGGVGAIAPGGNVGVSFDVPVGSPPGGVSASTPWSQTLSAHPAYSNLFAFGPGSDCGTTVNIYVPFTLTPTAHTYLDPGSEAPTTVNSLTYVQASGTKVSENVTSRLYEITAGGVTIPKGNTSNPGPFDPASNPTTCLYQSPPPYTQSGCDPTLSNGQYLPSTPVLPGDTYCSEIYVPVASGGYVGPGGYAVGGTADEQIGCGTVDDKPFFKVVSGDAAAGGAFSSVGNPNCSGGGVLAGWNNNSGTNPPGDFGASAQIGALALGPITGVASNQSTFNNNPTGLSFANTVPADKSVNSYSPKLGGNYNTAAGAGSCFTDATPPIGVSATAGPVTIGSTVISPGASQNQSYFVNGDVYITGNILYKGDNGATGAAASWNSQTNVPSMVIHATGDIKISPNVTEVDGLYMSTGGKIYTCAPPAAGAVPNSFIDTSFTTCSNQLTVYGKFVANQVNMGRTFGSLRDETPVPAAGVTGATSPLIWSCGGGTCNPSLSGASCVYINEPSEPPPNTWTDNQLCVPAADAGNVKLAWTYFAGSSFTPANDGGNRNQDSQAYMQSNGYPNCTSWGGVNNPPYKYPPGLGWVDNVLCSNQPVHFYPGGGHATGANEFCTPVTEPSDNQGMNVWNSSTICIDKGSAATPGHAATPPLTCSNASPASGWLTCAAEVFYDTPELYLSTPNIGKPSLGAQQWNAVTGLPPLL